MYHNEHIHSLPLTKGHEDIYQRSSVVKIVVDRVVAKACIQSTVTLTVGGDPYRIMELNVVVCEIFNKSKIF